MGWATGAEVAEELWYKIEDIIPQDQRQKAAQEIIDIFERYDCDIMEDTILCDIAQGN